MPQGGQLGPAADLVDHRVGQLDGVEVIHDHGGVAEPCDQRAGVAPPGVDRDRADPGQPAVRSGSEPAVHRGPGAVGHHIQQPAALQIDQAGHIPGRCCPGRPKEARLIHPQRGDTLHAGRVVHQLAAVVSHRPHHRRPPHPEVACHCGDSMGVLADPPAGFGAGPFGQHRPRTDRGYPLGPGPHPAGRLTTTPDPLAPAQHHWAAADRQVAHPHHASAVRSGLHTAARTADHRRRRLDGKLPLATDQLGRDDLQAVQVQQPRPRRTTLLTHLGPPPCRRQTSARYARPQVLSGFLPHRRKCAPPRFMTKSPFESPEPVGAQSVPAVTISDLLTIC
jgi:hypothetical protein